MANKLPNVPLQDPDSRRHRLGLATAVNELIKVRPPNDRTAAETAAGVTPVDYSYPEGDVRRYGVDPSDADVTAALQAAADAIPTLFFPPGTYRISSTIQRQPFSRWVGEYPQSNENGSGSVTPEVVIYGTVADIGDGNPLVRLCEADVAGSSYVTEYISFQSDLSVDTADLAATSSTGVVGVNIDHAKNGTEFIGCSFRNLKHAIQQVDTDPYSDKITLTRCHITRCYLAIDADPTAGISLVDSFIYDCRDWVQSATDVSLINCSLNNSSVASDTCGVKAALIVMIGGWVEGGNKVFQPTRGLVLNSVKMSEMQSSGTKFMIYPQNTEITIDLKNIRVPTNTRLFDLGLINSSDYDTIHIRAEGLQDGTNFANTASISGYLDDGLDWRGWGNQNSSDWNVDNAKPSGTWSPTLTAVANVDASTTFACNYTYDRQQGIVHCFGKINVDPTAVTTLTQVGISLPVASDFANEQDCAGTCAATSLAEFGAITADTTNNRAQINFISAGTANHTLVFSFSYSVI